MFLIQKQWLHFYYKAIRCFANEQDVAAKLEMEAKMESKRIKSFWRPTNGGWGCQKEHSGKREFCKRLFSLRLEVIGSILTHPLYTTSSWERATDWRRTDLGIRDKVRETIIFKEFFLFLKQKKKCESQHNTNKRLYGILNVKAATISTYTSSIPLFTPTEQKAWFARVNLKQPDNLNSNLI